MGRVSVDRSSQISFIEDTWLAGKLDGQDVDIHIEVYRCDAGNRKGQIGVSARVRPPGGGQWLLSSGMPNPQELLWANSREEAVTKALDALEAREDLTLKK